MTRLKQAWLALFGRRPPKPDIRPPGPPWPRGLGDYDVTESGYTFRELDEMEAKKAAQTAEGGKSGE